MSTLDHKRLLAEVAALRQRLADCAVESMAAAAESDGQPPGTCTAWQRLLAPDSIARFAHTIDAGSIFGVRTKAHRFSATCR